MIYENSHHRHPNNGSWYGFHPNAKWRLLEASTEEVKEPECVDPTLVAPSEARYKTNDDHNNKNDAKNSLSPTPIFVK